MYLVLRNDEKILIESGKETIEVYADCFGKMHTKKRVKKG
jgi:hypothetical protein